MQRNVRTSYAFMHEILYPEIPKTEHKLTREVSGLQGNLRTTQQDEIIIKLDEIIRQLRPETPTTEPNEIPFTEHMRAVETTKVAELPTITEVYTELDAQKDSEEEVSKGESWCICSKQFNQTLTLTI